MKALFLVALVLASPARAQDADAPLAVHVGDTVPFDGVLLTPLASATLYKQCEEAKRNAADMEKALLERPTMEPLSSTLVTVAISAGVGVIVGVVFTALSLRPKG